MGPIKTTWRSALGRPGKTGIWILLVAFFTLVSIVGFYINTMAGSYETAIIESELKNHLSDEALQHLQDDVSKSAWQYSGVAEMLMEISGAMLIGIYFTMAIVIVLLSVMWIRDHGNDIAIYAVLGQSKGQIVALLLMEMAMISVAAIVPASILGLFLVNRFGPTLILSLRDQMGYQYFSAMQEMDNTMLYTKLSWQTAAQSGLLILLLLMIAVTILGTVAVQSRTANLFEQER